jgi:hypothetical protein
LEKWERGKIFNVKLRKAGAEAEETETEDE